MIAHAYEDNLAWSVHSSSLPGSSYHQHSSKQSEVF